MKVVNANVNGKIIPIVIDESKLPVKSILKFIKFKEDKGCKGKTLKYYCYFLKLYFEFLEEENIVFLKIKASDLEEFLEKLKISNTEKSVKVIIRLIIKFYKYINMLKEYEAESIFLDNEVDLFIRKLSRENNKFTQKVLSITEIEELINACDNIRDKLFITLLFETGIRTSEALLLDFSSINWENKVIEANEFVRGCDGLYRSRVIGITSKLDLILNQYFEFYDVFKMNKFPLFTKSKDNMTRLSKSDINNLFRRLRKMTNIEVTPITIRASLLYKYFEAEDKSPFWDLDIII